MFDVTTLVIVGVIVFLGYWLLRKPSKLPPGPSSLELLKSTYQKNVQWEKLFLRWCRRFPKVFCLQALGAAPVVMVTDLDWMKKLFVQNADHFSNRPRDMWLINRLTNRKGITFNPESWRATRRFALHSMRDFGLGRQSLDERIQDEAGQLVHVFRQRAGTGCSFDPQDDIIKAVSNIICSITFGKRYQYSDQDFAEVLHQLDALFKSRFTNNPLNLTPALRHLWFLHNVLNPDLIEAPFLVIKEFVRKEINKHRETYDPEIMRDLVDLYLQSELNQFKDMKGMDEGQLFQVIVDLFMAGTDTTTGSLRWLLLHLINYPEVQKTCQQEIHKVFGTEKLPEYRERNQLPYTMAVIHESMRLNPVAFGTLQHVADREIELGEYVIPEGATVHGITIELLVDPKIWGTDVWGFHPERWLDEDGQFKMFSDYIPFGLGRRACPGEQLARTEILINAVALLQNFTFRAEDPEHPPEVAGEVGVTFSPNPFNIVALPVKA